MLPGASAIDPAMEPMRNTVASRLVTMEDMPTRMEPIRWNANSRAMRGRAAMRRGNLSSFFVHDLPKKMNHEQTDTKKIIPCLSVCC